MLSNTVIKTIRQDGSFYKDEFDFENNQSKTTDEVKDWFVQHYNIENRDSAFIEFYNLVASPPVGNGPDLFDLEQINEAKESFGRDSSLLIASGDTGSYVYHIPSDMVYEYDFMVHSYDDLEGGVKPCTVWDNFSVFLDAYYALKNLHNQ